MTAREPSAVEVIAEALGKHTAEACRGVNGEPGWLCACSRPGASRWFDTEGHREHQSAEVKAAIRAMSPSEQAELIGGEVEWASGERGYGDCAEQWPDRGDAEMDAQSIRQHGLDGVLFARLAAGPWRELIDADVTRDHEEDER